MTHDQITAAHLAATANAGPVSMVPADIAIAAQGQPAAGPGITRRAVRVLVALVRLTVRRAPRWAAALMGLCLLIPGPVDELVIVPAVMVYVAVRNRAEFAATARAAWTPTRN